MKSIALSLLLGLSITSAPAYSMSVDITHNSDLMASFTSFFGYKFNGSIRFPYKFSNLHFYSLPAWPNHVLVQNDDYTLPNFKNAMLVKFAPGSASYTIVSKLDTQRVDYDDSSISTLLCTSSYSCRFWTSKKNESVSALFQTLPSWESTFFDKANASVRSEMASSLLASHNNASAQQLVDAFTQSLSATSMGANGQDSLIASLTHDFDVKLCDTDIAAFFQRLRSMSAEEQDNAITQCGMLRDAQYFIKLNYQPNLLDAFIASCNSANLTGTLKTNCDNTRYWSAIFNAKTEKKEIKVDDNGMIEL